MTANHRTAWSWFVLGTGVALGVVVVALPLGGGVLVNLDLIAVGDLRAPRALVGLGGDLPRQAPLNALLAPLSPPLSAVAVTKLWMVGIVAVAFGGMWRSLRDLPPIMAVGAATAYATSPYLLTRLAVGHLGLASAAALLPWAFDRLLQPDRAPRRTFLWLCGFGLCGYFGMIVAAPVLVAGLIADRKVPRVRNVALFLASQSVWALPAALSIGDARGAESSAHFATDLDSLADGVRLLVGFGFWRSSNQLGREDAWAAFVALSLVVVAMAGWRHWSDQRRGPMLALGALGMIAALASGIPLVDDGLDSITGTVMLAPLRESQRLLVFTVFASITAAARGLDALAERRRAITAVLGAALGLAMVSITAGAFWGLDGATRAHDLPRSWDAVAVAVSSDPGITLALPWEQYFDVEIADGRRGHHPVPLLVDGDVIFSHDLGLGAGPVSRDPREAAAATLLRRLRLGEPVADQMRELDLQWIVALPDLGGDDIDLLRALPEVDAVIDEDDIALFRGPGTTGGTQTDWNRQATLMLVAHGLWLGAVGWAAVAELAHATNATSPPAMA